MKTVQVFLALIAFVALMPTCQSNPDHSIQSARAKWLALEMVEQRCFGQKSAFINGDGFLRTNIGNNINHRGETRRRSILSYSDAEVADLLDGKTPAEISLRGSRKLMQFQKIQSHSTALNPSVVCSHALADVNQWCTTAPDDQGPAVLMPWLQALNCADAIAGK